MAGIFDQTTVNQIQQANDIVELVAEYISLAKKGREMVGLCPFHEDHRPSLYVNGVKQIFKCFACGAGGDVFKFVQMRENLTFPQAVERLAERAGIKLKPREYKKTKADASLEDIDPNKLAKVNAWAAEHFRKNLADKQKGKNARDYIAARKIKPETAEKWGLGVALSQNGLLAAAKAAGGSIKSLTQAGLVLQTKDGPGDKFVNRLMFPIADVTGRVIGFGGRTLDDAGAKYINSPATALFDKSNALYGLQQARQAISSTNVAVVVEGYTDCLMAHQFGCCNVVATLGTSFTAGHARMLRRYAKKAVLIFDGDTAGLAAANRALEVCLAHRIDIRIASVPDGKDPCDFLLTAGKAGFEELVDESVDVFQFKWDRLTGSFNNEDTLTGKKAALEEFLQTITTAIRSGNLSAIDRGLIVNRLSPIMGLDSKEISVELSRRLVRAQKNAAYHAEERKAAGVDWGRGLSAAAQREILEVLLNEPKLFKSVKEKVALEAFDVPALAPIAAILFEMSDNLEELSLTSVLAKAESVELGGCLVQLAQAGEEKGNFQARLTGALDVLQQIGRRQKRGQIKAVEDQSQFLRRVLESSAKQDRHNLGMI